MQSYYMLIILSAQYKAGKHVCLFEREFPELKYFYPQWTHSNHNQAVSHWYLMID